ncbi:BLUF domain-containing protein [Pyruvatibacter mobilis]|jgi:hypothetical protein|nr:hypothetical protein GCM10011587_14110 [Pyruvatibacter mobilis]
MALCQLAYVSDIDRPCSPGDISNLVQAARRNNVRDNITGILLAGRGGFIQLVEGPRMAVIGLLDRLEADPRHHNMVVLHRGDAHLRAYPDCPMTFQYADSDSLNRLEMSVPALSSGLCSKLTAEAVGLI